MRLALLSSILCLLSPAPMRWHTSPVPHFLIHLAHTSGAPFQSQSPAVQPPLLPLLSILLSILPLLSASVAAGTSSQIFD